MAKRSSLFIAALVVSVVGAVVVSMPGLAQADDDRRLVPVNETYAGLSYGEWEAAWWQWAFSIPATSQNPTLPGGNSALAQSGPVWFLAGAFASEVRNITVPSGVALFIPVVNVECSNFEGPPFHGDDANALAICVNGHVDNTANLAAEIDGKPVKHLEHFRVRSPMFTTGPLQDPNLLGAPKGTITQSMDAGVYLLILPFKPGPHTVHVTGTFTVLGGTIDTTYNVAVTP